MKTAASSGVCGPIPSLAAKMTITGFVKWLTKAWVLPVSMAALMFSMSAALGPTGGCVGGGPNVVCGLGVGVVLEDGVCDGVDVGDVVIVVAEGVAVADAPPLCRLATRTQMRSPAKIRMSAPALIRVGNIQRRDFSTGNSDMVRPFS